MRSRLTISFLFLSLFAVAQDSVQVSEEQFLRQFLRYSPVMLIAQHDVAIAEAEVAQARAAFDPVWVGEFGSKELEGKDYYSYNQTAIKWDLPPGFSISAGADLNRGDFINPERLTPSEGLAYAEIKVPIGQGLFRSNANTWLQKTRLLYEASLYDLELQQREWVIAAAEAYWSWKATEDVVLLREKISSLSDQRYQQTVQRFDAGSSTAMDTLEAFNQVLKREIELLNSLSDREYWYRTVGGLIWEEKLIAPYQNGQCLPDSNWNSAANQVRVTSQNQLILHPKLQSMEFQLKSADLDRRLAREQLRPQIDLKARALSSPNNLSLSGNSTIIGLTAKVPILSRKERAKFRASEFKLEQMEWKITQTERDLYQKYELLTTQLELLKESLNLAETNAKNAFRLLEMEERKLAIGESTIFLLNRRENSYISAEVKRIELQLKVKVLEWKRLMLTEDPTQIIP